MNWRQKWWSWCRKRKLSRKRWLHENWCGATWYSLCVVFMLSIYMPSILVIFSFLSSLITSYLLIHTCFVIVIFTDSCNGTHPTSFIIWPLVRCRPPPPFSFTSSCLFLFYSISFSLTTSIPSYSLFPSYRLSLHLSSHQGTAKVQQIFTLGGKQKGMGTVAGVMVQSGYMKAGGGSSSGTYKGVDYIYRYIYIPVSLLIKLCFGPLCTPCIHVYSSYSINDVILMLWCTLGTKILINHVIIC